MPCGGPGRLGKGSLEAHAALVPCPVFVSVSSVFPLT